MSTNLQRLNEYPERAAIIKMTDRMNRQINRKRSPIQDRLGSKLEMNTDYFSQLTKRKFCIGQERWLGCESVAKLRIKIKNQEIESSGNNLDAGHMAVAGMALGMASIAALISPKALTIPMELMFVAGGAGLLIPILYSVLKSASNEGNEYSSAQHLINNFERQGPLSLIDRPVNFLPSISDTLNEELAEIYDLYLTKYKKLQAVKDCTLLPNNAVEIECDISAFEKDCMRPLEEFQTMRIAKIMDELEARAQAHEKYPYPTFKSEDLLLAFEDDMYSFLEKTKKYLKESYGQISQSREKGDVSLADGEVGNVSLANHGHGQISV